MTDQLTRCPACQAELTEPGKFCTSCGAPLDNAGTWPGWHGAAVDANESQGEWPRGDSLAGESEPTFEALALDPELIHAGSHHSGGRWAMIGLIGCAVVWFLVGLAYETGDPAAWWDVVWYGAGALTVGLALWLLVRLVGRARSQGIGSAWRWLVS